MSCREQPSASADRVFWIVDNASSHRGEASVKRLRGVWLNLRLIHLPTHASWLNQIEIYFSVVQRKVLTPNDFADLDALAEHLIAFQERYEQAARPFAWKFTRHGLNRLLSRLAEHGPLASSSVLAAWACEASEKFRMGPFSSGELLLELMIGKGRVESTKYAGRTPREVSSRVVDRSP